MKESWYKQQLGEIASFESGNRPAGGVGQLKEGALSLGGEHIGRNGRINLSSAKFVSEEYYQSNKKGHVIGGDILLCKDGALTGKVAIEQGELQHYLSMVNEHVFIIRTTKLLQRYLFYYLFSPIGQGFIKERITGSAQGGINGTQLKTIPVPFPKSLAEQERIVAELDLLSGIIDKQKAQLKELDNLAQSIFYDMFGNPVENDKGWSLKRIEDTCLNIVDCPHSTPKKVGEITPYPCIRTSELKDGCISWDTMQYLDEAEYRIRIARLAPKAGDIVFAREGTIGDAAILPEGYHFSLGQRTMLLRVNPSIISNVFLHRVIISEWVKKQIRIVNVSSTVAHVNIKDFKQFVIPIPPIALQQSFASKIAVIEQQKESINQSIAESQKLFDYTMDKYFG